MCECTDNNRGSRGSYVVFKTFLVKLQFRKNCHFAGFGLENGKDQQRTERFLTTYFKVLHVLIFLGLFSSYRNIYRFVDVLAAN